MMSRLHVIDRTSQCSEAGHSLLNLCELVLMVDIIAGTGQLLDPCQLSLYFLKE